MGRARRWAGEVTCDTVMTGELSAHLAASRWSACASAADLRYLSSSSAFEIFDADWKSI